MPSPLRALARDEAGLRCLHDFDMAHGLLKTAVELHVLYDPMRPPLTARDRVSVCIELIPQSKHARDFRERRLLRIAYKHTANAEKSTFFRCFGDMLADFT